MPFEPVTLNDGNKMPTIAFGTGSKWKGQDVADYVEQAIDSGFSHIDTAQYYANEDSVGAAIRASGLSRSDLFITTKFSGISSIEDAIQNSLAKLNLKQVDLYLIHNPLFVKDWEATWSEFENLRKRGLTKSIGVSNFNLEHMQQIIKIAKVKPAVNQIKFDVYNYAEHKELLEYCAKHNVVVEAYSSLAPITQYPGGPVDAPVNAAAKRLNATPTQVILAWVRSKGVVPVTTSSTKAHMEEYLAAGDLPALTEDEIAAIDAAGAKGPPEAQTGLRARRVSLVGLLVSWLFVMWLYMAHPRMCGFELNLL